VPEMQDEEAEMRRAETSLCLVCSSVAEVR